MSAIEPGSSLALIIPTLDLAQVPESLHCIQCRQFLINAYKTSCCDSKICEKCYSDNLPDHCPKCKHKPFSQELCNVAKAARGTARAYLRNAEKIQAEEQNKVKALDAPLAEEPSEPAGSMSNIEPDVVASQDTQAPGETTEPVEVMQEDIPAVDIQPSIEEEERTSQRHESESSDGNDDEVEIQVEPSHEDEYPEEVYHPYMDDEEQAFNKTITDDASQQVGESKDTDNGNGSHGFNMSNVGMNFNGNMDMNTMAMMQQMMMNGMNPMMGMPMGMNPGMFSGFSGQNGGMNGMNMGMMNFPNQNMFGWNGQNNSSWQNNNANAFSNGMGGDFSSQYGFDVSQQGNFQQQNFRNGDFQNGYNGYRGRGRFRGRGGFGRGRGSFNQPSQNNYNGYQNTQEQQSQETHNKQAQTPDGRTIDSRGPRDDTNVKEGQQQHNSEDFAPGGQDEVQEAIGGDHDEPKTEAETETPLNQDISMNDTQPSGLGNATSQEANGVEDIPSIQEEVRVVEKPIPEAYHEDFEAMAPPTAPMGPSGRYSERDYGFRSRGHGRYASRGRGSFPMQNGRPASPIRSISHTSVTAQSPPGKGLGVQGAPTGPRAMREPSAPKAAPRSNGGFQIMGRANMQSRSSYSQKEDRTRSPSLVNDNDNDALEEEKPSKHQSRHDRYENSRHEEGSDTGYDKNERDRKRRKSRRDDYDDHDMQDVAQDYSRPESQDRKSSHRSSRYDKERDRDRDKDKHTSKHRSSRRHYDDENGGDHEIDDYGEPTESRSSKHRSSHKSSGKTSSKHDEADRSKEDRHRKRSRHDRDREDDYEDVDEEESRHRSRRHKKDHHSSSKRDRDRDREREPDDDLGLRISGRSSKTRNTSISAIPTSTSTNNVGNTEHKDPHTLEREARNKERMLKEQQRREKAALDKKSSTPGGGSKPSRGTVSGGRRVSYKYEDEVERGMEERETARWR